MLPAIGNYFKMGKEDKKEVMGKIYREFSRQKYNKYKHQYPKMRQSEIVSKIIREWDSLDPGAKQKLKKHYEQNKILITDDFSQSETAKKSEQVKKVQRETTPKRADVSQPDESSLLEEVKSVEKLKWVSEKVQSNKEVLPPKPKSPSKHRLISKASSTDYITFFRHYYEKYSLEHPRWSSTQVSKIIRLLWKKNKNQRKLVNSKFKKGKLQRSTKQKKSLSGRAVFRKLKKLSGPDTKALWRHLPLESRRYWANQAQGKATQPQKQHKIILRACPEKQLKALDFLKRVIR